MKKCAGLIGSLCLLAACGQIDATETDDGELKSVDASAAIDPAVGIVVPDGFTATVFHDGLGPIVRHIAARGETDLYVTHCLGRNRSNCEGGVVALRDSDGDGVADQEARRDAPLTSGMEIHDGYLYVSSNTSVSRVALDTDRLMPAGDFETIVSGMPDQRSHGTKSLAFDGQGAMYVNNGAFSNNCQEQQRTPGSRGLDPCPELETQAGVWRFDAVRTGQTMADGDRYVSGVRNATALEWNTQSDALYLLSHGRDQFSQLWPDFYTPEQNAELPAEEFHRVAEGDHLGWPYTYWDQIRGERMTSPEYGGDGETVAGDDDYKAPIYGFPGHWAPLDLKFYYDGQFPEAYHGGAFVVFRGSWNRAPFPQGGYNVVFTPMSAGDITGEPVEFAIGFAGTHDLASPRDAVYRPVGLAVGDDGALYVSDNSKGRIWKIVYTGD